MHPFRPERFGFPSNADDGVLLVALTRTKLIREDYELDPIGGPCQRIGIGREMGHALLALVRRWNGRTIGFDYCNLCNSIPTAISGPFNGSCASSCIRCLGARNKLVRVGTRREAFRNWLVANRSVILWTSTPSSQTTNKSITIERTPGQFVGVGLELV